MRAECAAVELRRVLLGPSARAVGDDTIGSLAAVVTDAAAAAFSRDSPDKRPQRAVILVHFPCNFLPLWPPPAI